MADPAPLRDSVLAGMTLTQLSYVVAVDSHGHFGRAATACGVTQPTLSMQIGKLERTLGVTLFDRMHSPVIATDVGRAIVEQARVVLRSASRIPEISEEARGVVAGGLRLGVIPTLAPYLLPRFLDSLSRDNPHLELAVEELVTEAILDALRADSLDVGLIATPPGDARLTDHVLFSEPFVAYVSAGHRLARQRVVKAADLSLNDLWLLSEGHCLRSQSVAVCGERTRGAHGLRTRFESGNLETLKRLVERGTGMTLLPALAAAELATESQRSLVRPFANPAPVRQVRLVQRRADLKRRHVDALRAAILDSLAGTAVRIDSPDSRPPAPN
jgi:LysR family hydrogen peroxide-inducible transcriptional activator